MQVKKWMVILFLLMMFSWILTDVSKAFPNISAIAVVIYDPDFDLVVYEKNANQKRSIASLTKIMTILYICELIQAELVSPDDIVTASANAAGRGGTEINIKSGEKFTVKELLYAAALASANDAAVALAEYAAGSEREFAELMTKRAWELGLTETNFVDSTGLLSIYSGNYSTAYEMALLSKFAMDNELFKHFVSTKTYELKSKGRTITNSNVLLGKVDGVNGIKTGATTPAGHTLITSVERNERRLIIVMLGAPSRELRNNESEELVEYAYNHLQVFIPKGKVITQLNVPDGVTHLIDAVMDRELSLFSFNDKYADIETKYQLLNKKAPIEKGDKVGELTVVHKSEEIASIDLVSSQNTGLASFLRRLWNRIVRFLLDLF